MAYHGDKLLHIETVTIVNNHFCSRLLGARLLLFQMAYCYKRHMKGRKLHGVYVSSVANLDRTKKRVTHWSKHN